MFEITAGTHLPEDNTEVRQVGKVGILTVYFTLPNLT
jgi:hypothetical protein